MKRVLSQPVLFQWDGGNSRKIWLKHRVTAEEAEQLFFDLDRQSWKDAPHSGQELRYVLLGKTKTGRVLFVVFTIRKDRARVISARDANRKERRMYHEKKRKEASSAQV